MVCWAGRAAHGPPVPSRGASVYRGTRTIADPIRGAHATCIFCMCANCNLAALADLVFVAIGHVR